MTQLYAVGDVLFADVSIIEIRSGIGWRRRARTVFAQLADPRDITGVGGMWISVDDLSYHIWTTVIAETRSFHNQTRGWKRWLRRRQTSRWARMY